ncbi:nuclease-related domain-containing protein [Clostridium perfringens]|uniref:nuclease-related domain-containing protein n=1 Tax=Clostridium perfringens TaxID=1502 RepID=UPI0024BC3BFD|nr:nuclease-related domain-containing protein [Clostridium perfringens]
MSINLVTGVVGIAGILIVSQGMKYSKKVTQKDLRSQYEYEKSEKERRRIYEEINNRNPYDTQYKRNLFETSKLKIDDSKGIYFDVSSGIIEEAQNPRLFTLHEKYDYFNRLLKEAKPLLDIINLSKDCAGLGLMGGKINGCAGSSDLPYRQLRDLCSNLYRKVENEYRVVKLGIDGENRVNENLHLFRREFIKFDGARFTDSDGNSVECDNIIISPKGIFILEVKNYGETEGYSLKIDKTGGWRKVRGNSSESMNSPVGQNIRHIAVLKNILRDRGINVNVKGLVVIANEKVEIDNQSDSKVIRHTSLYEELSKGENILSEEQCEEISNIIKSILEPDKKYPTNNYDSFISLLRTYRALIIDEILDYNSLAKKENLDLVFLMYSGCERNYGGEHHHVHGDYSVYLPYVEERVNFDLSQEDFSILEKAKRGGVKV